MNYLNDMSQKFLRENQIITSVETAAKEGDLYIAVNVVNQSRRILKLSNRMIDLIMINEGNNNQNKRILKG